MIADPSGQTLRPLKTLEKIFFYQMHYCEIEVTLKNSLRISDKSSRIVCVLKNVLSCTKLKLLFDISY